VGADAVQEEQRDSESRHAGAVRRYHRGIGWGGLVELQRFVDAGGLLITLGSGSMLPLEGGMVRGVRREAGGVPRSTQEAGQPLRRPRRRLRPGRPGAHVRVSFARPDHPSAYGYPARTHVFRQNFPLYATPAPLVAHGVLHDLSGWSVDRAAWVLEWGDREGAPLVVSGQAWGGKQPHRPPAILDLRSGLGHVIAFNFNPLHRDLNRGDQRMLWNAIINWRAILAER